MVAAVRQTLLKAARSPLFERWVSRWELRPDRRRGLLRVLTYHRVDRPDTHPDLAPGMISATPEEFAVQMEHLATRERVLSVHELLAHLDRQDPLPPRSVLVTFDDAYRDFADHAWPILRRFGLPVTLFVPTAFPDQPQRCFWWDRLYASLKTMAPGTTLETKLGRIPVRTESDRLRLFKRLREHIKSLPHLDAMAEVDRLCSPFVRELRDHHVLTWDELRRLARDGVTLAPHTRTHPLLNRLSVVQMRDEVCGSQEDLRRQIGDVAPVFAYPAGGVDGCVVNLLREAGVRLAFTTRRGVNDLQMSDLLRLRRINVGRSTNLPLFRAQLMPELRWLNACWSS